MDSATVIASLTAIAQERDFEQHATMLVAQWRSAHLGAETVAPILRFIEEHPKIDFGSPGPLAHFVEGFYRAGYETELLASVERRPTAHTVWMLNRVINATKDLTERRRLFEVLRAAKAHPAADSHTKSVIDLLLGG